MTKAVLPVPVDVFLSWFVPNVYSLRRKSEWNFTYSWRALSSLFCSLHADAASLFALDLWVLYSVINLKEISRSEEPEEICMFLQGDWTLVLQSGGRIIILRTWASACVHQTFDFWSVRSDRTSTGRNKSSASFGGTKRKLLTNMLSDCWALLTLITVFKLER